MINTAFVSMHMLNKLLWPAEPPDCQEFSQFSTQLTVKLIWCKYSAASLALVCACEFLFELTCCLLQPDAGLSWSVPMDRFNPVTMLKNSMRHLQGKFRQRGHSWLGFWERGEEGGVASCDLSHLLRLFVRRCKSINGSERALMRTTGHTREDCGFLCLMWFFGVSNRINLLNP